ncbi:MAG: HDOD domain-containing protein [Aquabacterium sp.]|uniref:HDOD domain-containing protein n=1 Tax=Aquabacterium sp. TaxID=1872578 RepID=UPI001219DAE1|nr:HDOD domain-containing protein [Aquabacterium sp.]TAK98540.1 MAG: HDOD domain-containing protein [Aquabacterium sp.]
MYTQHLSAEHITAQVKELPALPEIVTELVRLMNDDGVSGDYLADRLAKDPGLSAKALRLANSSFYGLSRQIQTIPEALQMLGRRTVGLLVLAAAASDTIKVRPRPGFDPRVFWRHALGAALAGQTLARTQHLNPDLGFTVGLLHDIGQLALACIVPERLAAVADYKQSHDCINIEAEQAVLGTDHTVIGALLAERWQFSPLVVEAIAHHHAPDTRPGQGLVGVAHLADAISHALGLSGEADEAVPPTPPAVWAAIAPGNDACLQLFADVERQFEGVCTALHI